MFAALMLLVLSGIEVRGEGCGSLSEVRDEVRTRLGRDPDAMPTQSRFEIDFSQRGAAHHAKLTTTTAAGSSSRTFSSADCRELIESVGLAISISLDPTLLLEAERPAPARVSAPPPPVIPPPTPSPLIHLSVAAVLAAAAGVSGPATFSGSLSVGISRGPWWLGLEGRVEVPVTLPSGASAFTTLGTVAPGWQHGILRLSLPVSVGALLVSGVGPAPVRDSRVVVLAGVDAAFRWVVSRVLTLEPFVRAQVVATRITLLAGPSTVWVTWPIAALAGISARFELPL